MSRHLTKLIAALMFLLVALTVFLVGSYAWYVMSTAPETSNMQISIGGGNTILVAPDVTQVRDGVTTHFPGAFSQTLNFADSDGSSVLGSFGGLKPVSTADGLHWYIPSYRSLEDGGALMELADFTEDATLEFANRADVTAAAGSYLYLDFWVVSPASHYTLRVSTGTSDTDKDGSFVLARPQVITTPEGGYILSNVESQAQACVRLGFLVNEEEADQQTLSAYTDSEGYKSQYHTLKGVYPNKGEAPSGAQTYFTIYEPNADLHPADLTRNGKYVATRPIGAGKEPVDVADILTVQKKSVWTTAETGTETVLNQMLQAALLQAESTGVELKDDKAIAGYLFDTYLQNQLAGCVTTGSFLHNTEELYKRLSLAPEAELSQLTEAGATEDVSIARLKANVPQRIRLFIWLEGQDVDCTSQAAGNDLIVKLELAGESGEAS